MKILILILAFVFAGLNISNVYSYPISKKEAIKIVKSIPSVKKGNLILESIDPAKTYFDYDTGKPIGIYYLVKMKKFRSVLVNVHNGKLLIADSAHFYIEFDKFNVEWWEYHSENYL